MSLLTLTRQDHFPDGYFKETDYISTEKQSRSNQKPDAMPSNSGEHVTSKTQSMQKLKKLTMQTGKRTRRIQTVNKSKYKPLIIQGDSEKPHNFNIQY